MFNEEVKSYISKCVLCWLATCDRDMEPNVSPKEIFTFSDNGTLLIANIASPESIRNIKVNPAVCVSFVDIFVQKGFKLKGIAKIIDKNDVEFADKVKPLTNLFTDQFPIQSVIEIEVTSVNSIKAPSYFLFPETTTETSQVANAMKTYGVKP
jgi:uncharacterized protein